MAEWKHPGDKTDPKEQTVETSQKGEGKDNEVKNVKWKLTKMEARSTSANIQVMGILDKGKYKNKEISLYLCVVEMQG